MNDGVADLAVEWGGAINLVAEMERGNRGRDNEGLMNLES